MNSIKKLTCLCGLFAFVLSACVGVKRPVLSYEPTKAPTEAMIDRCENLAETQEVKCPINVFLRGVYNFADMWEYSQKCGKKLTACQKYGAVDKAEMQGHLNKQTARADKNARWIWYMAGGGIVLSVITLILGALAL